MDNLLVVWHNGVQIGIPILDEQHHGLATLVNSLFYCMGKGHAKEVLLPTISAFDLYAKVHFDIEEDMLRHTNYPYAEQHTRAHQKLHQQLLILSAESRITGDPSGVVDFFRKTWIAHLNEYDRQFVDHVKAFLNAKHV